MLHQSSFVGNLVRLSRLSGLAQHHLFLVGDKITTAEAGLENKSKLHTKSATEYQIIIDCKKKKNYDIPWPF